MNVSRLRPKVVLWWGIGLAVGGLLLAVLVPQLTFSYVQTKDGVTTVDQGLMTLLDLAARVVTQAIAPLGVALIAAAIVMMYVRRLTALPEYDEGAAPVE